MKSTVFVRPNLKMFLLGALLLLVIQHLIDSGHSQGSGITAIQAQAREVGSEEIHQLLRAAAEQPNSAIFTRLSACYEKRGEYRKALMYLRKAEVTGETEDSQE